MMSLNQEADIEKVDHRQHYVHETEHDHSEASLYGGFSTLPLWKTYLAVCSLTLLFICNTGSLQSMNVAVGFVAQALEFEPQQIQWIQSAYGLSSGCLLLLFVPLSDQFGARNIVLFGGSFFCVWAIACANAKTANQFIVFRALEGLGACAVVPAGFGVLAQMLPVTLEKTFHREVIIAIFAAGAPLGSALGTIFGGLPTQYSAIKWRGIFAVFAGMSGVATILAAFILPPNVTKKVKGGVDYIGAAIVTVSLTFILFCLAQGPATVKGFNTPYIVALLTIGCILMPVFGFYEWWLERNDKTPMLRMSNFSRGRYAIICALGLLGFGGFATWDYWAGLYYAQVVGLDAKNIMLRYLPQSLGGLAGGPLATILLVRFSTQYVFMLGCACVTFGSMIFALADITDTYWNHGQFFAFYLCITGACAIYQSGMLYCVSVVVPSEMQAAGGLFQVMTSLAASFGLCISTIVGTRYADPTDPTSEFTYGFWTALSFAAFAFVAAIPALWGIGILNKTGETARVEELVAHHHEEEVTHAVPHHHEDEATQA